MVAIMLILVFAVIATAVGVLYWFFLRLRRIEVGLWGDKEKEAAETARAEAEALAAEAKQTKDSTPS